MTFFSGLDFVLHFDFSLRDSFRQNLTIHFIAGLYEAPGRKAPVR